MKSFLDLMQCPVCSVPLASEERCRAGDHSFASVLDVVDYVADADRPAAAEAVTRFYDRFPFPGYRPSDDARSLIERSRASSFLDQLDRAIPSDATVLDAGCGTGQVAAFLGLAGPHRRVIGVDACLASLAAAEGFRAKARISNLRFLRGDLFHLPLANEAFDVVVSRGVVHHTPDPDEATRSVAARVKPGGSLVLGFYENVARLPHRMRRVLARIRGEPLRFLDPVLRRPDFTEEKKRIWIEDQYRHPLERMLPVPDVVAKLERLGFEWIRTVPPAVPNGEFFRSTARPSRLGLHLRRIAWAATAPNDPDAGLICVVARKRSNP